jgi:hypothetical protein
LIARTIMTRIRFYAWRHRSARRGLSGDQFDTGITAWIFYVKATA